MYIQRVFWNFMEIGNLPIQCCLLSVSVILTFCIISLFTQLAQKKRSEKWKELESKAITDVLKSLVRKELKTWEQELNSKCQNNAHIIVVNNVDLEGPPQDFVYISDYIAGTGVEIPSDPLVGCECVSCSSEAESRCCPQNGGVKFAYSKHKLVKVKPGTPIYECNKRCQCGPQCPNRVVQLGRKHKLAIFKTSNSRGWGVKTLVDIKKNSFVMEYVGEVKKKKKNVFCIFVQCVQIISLL